MRQFLQDILDTLFSILDDNTEKYGPLVFQSLVSVGHSGALQEPPDGSTEGVPVFQSLGVNNVTDT